MEVCRGTYSPELHGDNSHRRTTYGRALQSLPPTFRSQSFAFDEILVDPFYQLVRLTLLGAAMEAANELDADRVRIAWVRPRQNLDLRTQIRRDGLRALGETVEEAWSSMLLEPSRFVGIDSGKLLLRAAQLEPQGGGELKRRYGHIADGL